MSNQTLNHLLKFIQKAELPHDRILFLHVRLKGLIGPKDDYGQASRELIEKIVQEAKPKSILVPTYSYSFTKTGVFHRIYSRSEVGRFSEELRLAHGHTRTPEPIFSVVEPIGQYLSQITNLSHTEAFGAQSIFSFLERENAIAININLNKFISTQLHYLEHLNKVPYRYDKIFQGVVYYNETRYEAVRYKYYVRSLTENLQWDRPRIASDLEDAEILRVIRGNGMELNWLNVQDLRGFISRRLAENPLYLLK
jgi:aminoglycoside 3-N-acetyltransferase